MASLKSLLGTKQDDSIVAESNPEKGQIFVYHDGANYQEFGADFVSSDTSGTAVVEAGTVDQALRCAVVVLASVIRNHVKKKQLLCHGDYICGCPGQHVEPIVYVLEVVQNHYVKILYRWVRDLRMCRRW